jgi:hypothetical protein
MAWVVDTCILLDVGLDDPAFGKASEALLQDKVGDGLVVCPVTFVELAPAFSGDLGALRRFLCALAVDHAELWQEHDTEKAATSVVTPYRSPAQTFLAFRQASRGRCSHRRIRHAFRRAHHSEHW